MPVRERELELNSVKKSNTSGSGSGWKSTALIVLGARFLSHAYLLFAHNRVIKDGGIVLVREIETERSSASWKQSQI